MTRSTRPHRWATDTDSSGDIEGEKARARRTADREPVVRGAADVWLRKCQNRCGSRGGGAHVEAYLMVKAMSPSVSAVVPYQHSSWET